MLVLLLSAFHGFPTLQRRPPRRTVEGARQVGEDRVPAGQSARQRIPSRRKVVRFAEFVRSSSVGGVNTCVSTKRVPVCVGSSSQRICPPSHSAVFHPYWISFGGSSALTRALDLVALQVHTAAEAELDLAFGKPLAQPSRLGRRGPHLLDRVRKVALQSQLDASCDLSDGAVYVSPPSPDAPRARPTSSSSTCDIAIATCRSP